MAKEHVTVLESAVRTADSTTNFTVSSKGGILLINTTLDAASASVVFTLRGVNPVLETSVYTILVSAAVNAVGTRVLRIYPGLTAVANLTATDILPAGLQLFADHTDSDAITYSVEFIGVD